MATEEFFTKSNMTVKNMAEVFETLDDIDQAQFFVELAAIAKNWPRGAERKRRRAQHEVLDRGHGLQVLR